MDSGGHSLSRKFSQWNPSRAGDFCHPNSMVCSPKPLVLRTNAVFSESANSVTQILSPREDFLHKYEV